MRIIAALLVSVCVAQSATAGGEFPGRSLFLGQGANAVEVADLDLDGDLDAVVLDSLGCQLFALVGDGTGALQIASSTLVATPASIDTPNLLDVGDFDADGRPDAVVGHTFADKVTIVRNLGSASLAVFGTLPFGASPSTPMSQLHCADLDANGRSDLVVVRDHALYVAFAQPGFGLSGPVLANAIPSSITAVASRDFDGDGAAELLAGTVAPMLQLYANDGNGVFTASTTSPTNAFDTHALALADIDGDGDDDVVRVGEFDEPVVLRGDGSGAFVDPTAMPTASFSVRVELGDINGDGFVDALFGPKFGDAIATFGNGTGLFAPLGELGMYPSIANGIALGDLDGDGADDVFAALGTQKPLAIRMSNGAGNGFGLQALPNASPGAIAATDFDLDGDEDLVVKLTSSIPFVARSLSNDGFGHFQPASPDVAVPGEGFVLELADFDADGIDDLVTLGAGSLRIRRGLLGGGFAAAPNGSVAVSAQPGVLYKFAAADFDGDNRLDLAYGTDLLNPCGCQAQVWFGNGSFGFSAPVSLVLGGFPLHYPLAAADVNSDGRDDLISLGQSSGTTVVAVRHGTATKTFAAPSLLQPPGSGLVTSGVAAGDFDGDGDVDVVAAGVQAVGAVSGGLFVWTGDGAGNFGFAGYQPGTSHGFPRWTRAIDVEQDGDLDVVAALSTGSSTNESAQHFAVFRNDGTGVLVCDATAYHHTASSGATPRLVHLDADQHADVFFSNFDRDVEFARPDVACAGRFQSIGAGCFASTSAAPSLLGAGCPTPGATISFKIGHAKSNTVGLLVLGTQATALPTSTGCGIYVTPPFVLAVTIPVFGVTAVDGFLSIEAPIPVGLPPLEVDLQYFQAEPASEIGFVSSNGLRVLIQ